MTDGKTTAAAVLKYLLLLAFAAFLMLRGAGNRVSSAPFGDVRSAVLSAADRTPMSEGDNQMLRRLYGLDPESLEGSMLYYPTSSMAVEEILLVKLADTAQGDAVRSAMEARVASQRSSFEGYGPDQVALLDRSVIEVRGNYAILIVAEDTETVLRAFTGAL